MANYVNSLLVYVNGKLQRLTSADSLEITGGITAGSFSGDGSALTNLSAANISGTLSDSTLSGNVAKYNDAAPNFANTLYAAGFSGNGSQLSDLNASNLTTGTVADARLSSNVAKYTDTAPEFDNTVIAPGFSGSGAALTNLNASNVSTGTLADARLSSNIPRLNAEKTSFAGDVSIAGDLSVQGKVISKVRENVVVGDNFIGLLSGNTSTVADEAGGFTVTTKAVGSALTATAFFVGAEADANPYMAVSATPVGTIAAGDIIGVSGTTDGKNDGLYAVLSVDVASITVKGLGLTGISAHTPFVHNQFVAQAGQTATVSKVAVSVLASSNGTMAAAGGAIPAGVLSWNYASPATETAFTGTWRSLDSVSQTLQTAYEGGNTVTLVDGANFTVNAPDSGNAAISLNANSDSNITVDGGDFTLEAETIALVGTVAFSGSGAIGLTTTGRAVGDIVYVNSSTAAALSDNVTNVEVDGVIVEAGLLGTVVGTKMAVGYTGSAPAVGDTLWLSAVPGKGTNVTPTSGRVLKLGRVVGAGSSSLCTIIWAPAYVVDL